MSDLESNSSQSSKKSEEEYVYSDDSDAGISDDEEQDTNTTSYLAEDMTPADRQYQQNYNILKEVILKWYQNNWASLPPSDLKVPFKSYDPKDDPIDIGILPASEIDCFLLFMPDFLIEKIAEYTNEEIDRLREKYKKQLRKPPLEYTNVVELKGFFGLLLYLGRYNLLNSLKAVFSIMMGPNAIEAHLTFARDRFLLLCRAIHFDSKNQRETDADGRNLNKLVPIEEVFNAVMTNCKESGFKVGSNVTVDETVIGFEGRCSFRTYTQGKAEPSGIKIWSAVDPESHYYFNGRIYLGKHDALAGNGLGERVVLEVAKDLLAKGRTIYADNFFTSISLARQLWEMKTFLVGTIQLRRVDLPKDFVKEKLQKGEAKYAFSEYLTLVLCQPRKDKTVGLLSTKHHEIKYAQNVKKPDIVDAYNKGKTGVDKNDQMLKNFGVRMITRRWPFRIFCWLLDVCALNAMVVFKTKNVGSETTPLSKLDDNSLRPYFIEQLAVQLMQQQQKVRAESPTGRHWVNVKYRELGQSIKDIQAKFRGQMPTKYHRCRICYANGKDYVAKEDQMNQCKDCHKFFCKDHSKQFFICDHCEHGGPPQPEPNDEAKSFRCDFCAPPRRSAHKKCKNPACKGAMCNQHKHKMRDEYCQACGEDAHPKRTRKE